MKIKVGILGATGNVGQRFIQMLENHPIFELRITSYNVCYTKLLRHGGKIWIEDNPQGGAVFVFTLPVFTPPAI